MSLQNVPQHTDETSAESLLITRLRQLRSDAARLHSSLVEHLKPFERENGSFKTLPDSPEEASAPGHPDVPDVSVASTATVIMAAITARKEKEIFKKKSIEEVFADSVRAKWGSSGLPDGNAFTTAMLVRSAGFLINSELMGAARLSDLKHDDYPDNENVAGKTVKEIVEEKAASDDENRFAVRGYPPKAPIAYWFVDGAVQASINLGDSVWKQIGRWASDEFHRQLIYVSTGNDSLMDPPSLAMAACLISRVRRLCADNPHRAELTNLSRKLPSRVELSFGIEQVFSQQPDSGIWHKYFPLFHFPFGKGAADYCFSFEFLEGILAEFGTSVLRRPEQLQKFERAVRWCEKHQLEFREGPNKVYRGWNSGGEVENLAAGKPESWATASVHMFLIQLDRKISKLLDELVLKRFNIDRTAAVKSPERFEQLIDVSVTFPNEEPTTLRTVLEQEILVNVKKTKDEDIIAKGLPAPRSVLLFGPPGTSKTSIARAVAQHLGWPLVVITPSEFLSEGLEQVHARVDDVFRDLMDLQKAVVFFDEMDALAQTREGEQSDEATTGTTLRRLLQPASLATRGGGDLDVTRHLLTTSMLPKLANLWGQKRVIYLMATNHKQHLDPAITRPSRFDLLLCVAPPLWRDKCVGEKLGTILSIADADDVEKELEHLAPLDSGAVELLNMFTVTEVGIFLNHLQRMTHTSSVLSALKTFKDASEFGEAVSRWAETSITLRKGSRTRSEFERDVRESRRQYYPGQK